MENEDYTQALSGEEVVIDACSRLAEFLRRDCNLRESDAYEGGYSGVIKVSLKLYGMDTIEVSGEVPFTVGKPQGDPDNVIEADFEIPVEPALNVVRERSDQPVPTMTILETGEQIIRPRRYVRREKVSMGGATGEMLP